MKLKWWELNKAVLNRFLCSSATKGGTVAVGIAGLEI